jgi:hypothetical protein
VRQFFVGDEEREEQSQRDYAVLAKDPAFQKSWLEFARIAAQRDLGNWSFDEAAVVYHYSTDLNKIRELNKQLREGQPDEHNRALRRLLDKALSKAPAYEGTLFRRIQVDDLDAFLERYKEGVTVTEDAFVSTTNSRRSFKARKGNASFFITGRTGREIEQISGKPLQHEVLFRTGTRLEILQVNVLETGIEIVAREA